MKKPKSTRTLKSVAAVVKALGGPKAIAEWTGAGATSVSNWKTWGFIPPAWYYLFATKLAESGYEVDPWVFGFRRTSDCPSPRKVA